MNPYILLEQNILNKEIRFLNTLNLFEAGFEDLGYIMEFYNSYKFERYTGIEIQSEFQTTFSFTNSEGIPKKITKGSKESIYDRYIEYCEESPHIKKLSNEKFYDVFKLHFETPIEKYIIDSNVKPQYYNVGIFSKLFHRFGEKETPKLITKWYKDNSTTNSLLLFTVRTSNRFILQNEPIEDKFVYLDEDVEELIYTFGGMLIDKHKYEDSFTSYLVMKNVA